MEMVIQSNEKYSNPESRYTALAKILAKNFISVIEVDLRTGNAIVLESRKDPELVGRELRWSALLNRYAQRRAYRRINQKCFRLRRITWNLFWIKEAKRFFSR